MENCLEIVFILFQRKNMTINLVDTLADISVTSLSGIMTQFTKYVKDLMFHLLNYLISTIQSKREIELYKN